MRIKNTAAALTLLSASVFAQSAPSQEPGAMPRMPIRRAPAWRARQATPAASDLSSPRLREFEDTVTKMQALLKRMQKSATKNRAAQDELAMWELLVEHLNRTLMQTRSQAAERADIMARREAMYKQAQAKADAEAARAFAAKAPAEAMPATGTSAPSATAPAVSVPTQSVPVGQGPPPQR